MDEAATKIQKEWKKKQAKKKAKKSKKKQKDEDVEVVIVVEKGQEKKIQEASQLDGVLAEDKQEIE